MGRHIVSILARLALVLFFACVFTPALRAQYYLTGEDPARLKWNQLRTGSIQLIYPQGLDSLAFRYAYLMEHSSAALMQSLRTVTPRIPVVLHPYDLNSNGLVVWAPKRMEVQTTPPSEDGNAQNWEKQLVLHEVHHVAQMQRAGENVIKPLGWFLGQQAEGLSVGLYFPSWMLEGDATLEETLLSSAGRGREASFLMPYKAYWADSIQFSADKWGLGSYVDRIPDKYANGYFRLSAARAVSDPGAMDRMFTRITKKPYWPFVFRRSFKEHLGTTAVGLWKNARQTYGTLWEAQQQAKVPFSAGEVWGPESKYYAEYRSPVVLVDSMGHRTVYARRWSQQQTSSLVRLARGEASDPELLCRLGAVNSRLSTDGRYIYWSENVSGHRWAHENFSVVRRYDLSSGKATALTRRTRYFNPVPLKDSDVLAVVHYPAQGGSELHIISALTGDLFFKYKVPAGRQLSGLDWLDGNILVGALTGDDGKALYSVDLRTGKWTQITPAGFSTGATVKTGAGCVYFENDHSGTENICAVALDSCGRAVGGVQRLTEAAFGAFDPFPAGDRLYYSNYTSKGYRIYSLPTDSLVSFPEDVAAVNTAGPLDGMTSPFNIDTLQVPGSLHYDTKRYRKFPAVFRVHSWMPFYFDIDALDRASFQTYYQVVSAGASVMAQNTLGTAVSWLGYRYHKGFHSGHLKYTFSGWLPVITAEGHFNERWQTATTIERTEQGNSIVTDTLSRPNFRVKLYSYIPFTFNSGGWNRGFIPSVRYEYTNDRYAVTDIQKPVTRQMLQFGMQFYQVRHKALRDIYPRWGLGLNFQYAQAPGAVRYFTRISYAQVYGYLPGLFGNQGLKLTVSYQKQASDGTAFYLGSFLSGPRGTATFYAPQMYQATADYAIPILFRDFSLPPVLYIERMQVIPFVDYLRTAGYADGRKESFGAVGADLLFDFHIFRIGYEISAGIRYAWTFDNRHTVEALFSLPAF